MERLQLKLQAFTEVAISLYLPEKASDDIFRANRTCLHSVSQARRVRRQPDPA